ncbi:hypothetical protein MML48_3g00015585 [Holotrichia oblita]|uniref:Uncharacterized protein n=1 Tax=Holotrichia oblita TaxID=644536 RepID=A0ACB9THW2_HOLOL|nr:hypothetical protein MML48_3g00015585 [Holotrichia oblita]
MDLPNTFVSGFHDESIVKKMKFNSFGNTALKVSQLSLGAAGFSTLYGAYGYDSCKQALLKALKSGINYIDSAYWYGQNVSQQLLGEFFKEIPRESYYMATKVGRYELEKDKMFDFSAEKTRWCIENNLKTLGLEYIDILQIHDIEFAPSIDYVIKNTLPVLVEARDKGLIKHIGVTGYPVSALKEFVEKTPVKIDMILSYARLNLLDDTLKEYLPYFKEQGLGIVNASGLAMGLLSEGGPQDWHPADENIRNACKKARDYCQENGTQLSKLAMHYVYNQPNIDTNLVGMNTPELVEANLNVLYNGITKEEEDVLNYITKKYVCFLY